MSWFDGAGVTSASRYVVHSWISLGQTVVGRDSCSSPFSSQTISGFFSGVRRYSKNLNVGQEQQWINNVAHQMSNAPCCIIEPKILRAKSKSQMICEQ